MLMLIAVGSNRLQPERSERNADPQVPAKSTSRRELATHSQIGAWTTPARRDTGSAVLTATRSAIADIGRHYYLTRAESQVFGAGRAISFGWSRRCGGGSVRRQP